MKTLKILVIIVIAALSFTTCKKEEKAEIPVPITIHLSGKVMDRYGKPISDCKLLIGERPQAESELFEKSAHIVYTDSLGNYSFDYLDKYPYKTVIHTREDRDGSSIEHYNYVHTEILHIVKEGYFEKKIELPSRSKDFNYRDTSILRKQTHVKYILNPVSPADGISFNGYKSNLYSDPQYGCRYESPRYAEFTKIVEADTMYMVKWSNYPGGYCYGRSFEKAIHTKQNFADTLVFQIDY